MTSTALRLVVRPNQGGDTVSGGQAYGMLLAERLVTTPSSLSNVQLGNGLVGYHANAAGQDISRQPASDADLLIAWALLRYSGSGAAGAQADGRRVASAILAHEVTHGPGGMPVLTAGPWATGRPVPRGGQSHPVRPGCAADRRVVLGFLRSRGTEPGGRLVATAAAR